MLADIVSGDNKSRLLGLPIGARNDSAVADLGMVEQ